MSLRDHEPIILEEFNGLWDKGDIESVPRDHFSDCENIKFIGAKSFGTRDGVGLHQSIGVPLKTILRMYNYITQDANTLLVLVWNSNTNEGEIYHVANATTVYGPILAIPGMLDFAFQAYAGRAYISPFLSTGGNFSYEKGMQGEFVYVYKGNGTASRKAAGGAPTGTLTIANGAAGNTDAGFHLFGVVFETDTGYLSSPAGFNSFTTGANTSVSFSNIPVSIESFVTKRHIVATKIITDYTGNTTGYEYYFIPNATINDNFTTTLPNISFFDIDLLESASHLLDNFTEIPAGAVLGLYHNRLMVAATYNDISVVYLSAPGEPEAFNQIDGILIIPLDGNPVTNLAELRDILYVMKRNKTVGYADNDDVPSLWPMTTVDQALGTGVHGIATVIDQGSSSVDFLLVATYGGIMMFNGKYIPPPLTWKIDNLWELLDRNEWKKIQMLNDSILKIIYLSLPNGKMLIGDYKNGMDPKNMKWATWKFDFTVTTIALVETNTLILGGEKRQTI